MGNLLEVVCVFSPNVLHPVKHYDRNENSIAFFNPISYSISCTFDSKLERNSRHNPAIFKRDDIILHARANTTRHNTVPPQTLPHNRIEVFQPLQHIHLWEFTYTQTLLPQLFLHLGVYS